MQFRYEPGITVELGAPWDPQDPTANRLVGGYFERQATADFTPAATDTISQRFVKTFQDLSELTRFSLDSEGRGSIGVFKARGSTSYARERELIRNRSNVVWVLTFRRQYEPVSAPRVALTETGSRLLAAAKESGDINALTRAFGSHVVTSITKVAEVHLLYVFTASTETLATKIRGAISVHASAPVGSGTTTANFLEEVRRVDSQVQLDIQAHHIGVDDRSESIAAMAAQSPGDLEAVRRLFATIAKETSWNKARVLEFGAEPLERFIQGAPGVSLDLDLLYSRLHRLEALQEQVVLRYLELDDLGEQARRGDISLKDGARKEIEDEAKSLDRSFEDLDGAVKRLRQEPQTWSGYPELHIASGRLHWINLDLVRFNAWEYQVSGNTYDSHSERVVANAEFWPVFRISNIDFIKRFELLRDGNVVLALDRDQLSTAVEHEVLTTRSRWSIRLTMSEYCWRGHWGEVCNPWAADVAKLANQIKTKDQGHTYSAAVVDVENNRHLASFADASATTF